MKILNRVMFGVTAVIAGSVSLHAEDRPPNIVIIFTFTDDQGYADVGCFRAPRVSRRPI